MHVFLVFATPRPVQGGSRSFFLGGIRYVRPALRQDFMHVFLVFAIPRLVQAGSRPFFREVFGKCDLPCARRVAAFFPGGVRKVQPALRKAGHTFSLGGQITYTFEAAGLRFGSKRP